MQAALAQLPCYHNIALIEKLDNPDERLWYARQAIQTGWSRNVLVHQIETQLYARQGKALTNFSRTLPPPQSSLRMCQRGWPDCYILINRKPRYRDTKVPPRNEARCPENVRDPITDRSLVLFSTRSGKCSLSRFGILALGHRHNVVNGRIRPPDTPVGSGASKLVLLADSRRRKY